MGLGFCVCLTRTSEEIDDGEDLYPVPKSGRRWRIRQKIHKEKKDDCGRQQKISRKSNPYAEDPSSSPHEIHVLKDMIPVNRFRIRVSDKYVLGRELGRGEFGITHLCTDRLTKKDFACKSISKSKLRSAVDMEDVRREVAIMSILPDHPNIVKFHAVYEDPEAVHIIMELCEGGELFDRIVSRGHYSERAAASILRTIAEVIKISHANGIIHRDLKPENFLFSDRSENSPLKAIDFGLSVFFSPGEKLSEIVGSPYYMAPDVLRRNYGPEVDIWSAGVILYILLCGFPPFWAETDQGVARAILRDSLDFEREPWPQVSDNAKNLVRQMLERDPKRRLTVQQVLSHPWLQDVRKAPNAPLGDFVRSKLKQFSAMHKFKKKAIRVIAEHLAVEVIRNMFELMDTNGDGKIVFEELKAGLMKVGSLLGETEMKMLMNSADTNGNGFLDYGEFAAVSFHLLKMENDDHLRRAFSFFDQNQSGFIEFDELTEALTTDSHSINKSDTVINIMQEVDTDKDGRISYDEFVAMMKAGTDWRKASRQYSRERFRSISIDLAKDGLLKV